MRLPRTIQLLVFAAATVWLTACGGGGGGSNNNNNNTPPPAISVAFSPVPPTSIVAGTATPLTAIVTNDNSNGGVKWSVSCSASACGSFSPTSTASGATTSYTPPSTPPTSPATVTITATSVTDGTKTASTTITITSAAPAITVAFSAQPPSSLAANATTSITAVVTNDSSNGGVKWTVTCGSSACGSFSPTSTASGTATTYTAPSAPPSPATVTVTATSVTDTTKTASATITITAAAVTSVAFSAQPPASLFVGATTSITAVVTNDSKNAGVTWSVTCGSSGACGSFSPTSTASGTATTYTAPSAPPSPATVTITATSVTDTTKTASATISINYVFNNGNYVYHVSREDSTGPYFIVGAFTVQNGVITAGEQDFSDHANAFTNNLVASGSSLSTAGGNLQIVLNTGNSSLGVNGLETFRGARVSASRVLISEFDTFGAGTGSIDLQTSTAAPSGGYAFNLSGLDGAALPLVIGGVLDITGTSISNTGSVFDYNDAGSVGQAQLFSSGSVTAPDTFGRLTFTLTPSGTNVPGFVLHGYIIGGNRIQLVEALNDPLNGHLGGVALGQGTHTGNFTAANVSNTTYVFTGAGADGAPNGGVQNLHIAASFTFNTNLNVTGTLAVNDITAVVGTATIGTGAYTIDPTGRVTVYGVTPTISGLIPLSFQLYLDGNGNALELGVDKSQLSAGMAYQQTATSALFAGSYALSGQGFGVLTNSKPAWGAAGPVTVTSNSFAGFTDYTIQGGTPTSNVSLTGTETSATSLLALTGLNAGSAQTSNSFTYFVIDNTRVIAIETDGQQLGLLLLEAVSP